MIQGISHITLIVQSIERATLFFKSIFSADIIYDSGGQTFSLSEERYFLIGSLWIVVMKGDSLAEKTYNHIAFKIDKCDFEAYKARVESLGLEIREPRSRAEGEGQSLYFYDYDNHLFELHTGTLDERVEFYSSVKQARR